MPSVTSKRPEMLISCDCRHRLGFTESGAGSPSLMKAYLSGFQIGVPLACLRTPAGSGAMKPLCASSKAWVSPNGNALSTAWFAALVASDAGFSSCARAAPAAAVASASTVAVRA